MIDDAPQAGRITPVRASIRSAQRIGAKCVVSELEHGWICAHGTDGEGKPDESDSSPDIAPAGSVGIDTSQAVVYFHPGDKDIDAKAVVVSPDNISFRLSSQGRVPGRSRSFNEDGKPLPEVQLLYALKTGREMDRHRALSLFSNVFWVNQLYPSVHGNDLPHPTFGEIFAEMLEIAEDLHSYQLFVGRLMAQAAKSDGGLDDWALWEKVASAAAQISLEQETRVPGMQQANFEELFLQAVQETTIAHGGLPAQKHVHERWEELGGQGEWKDNRRKMGFDWLPPFADWRKDWTPLQSHKSQGE